MTAVHVLVSNCPEDEHVYSAAFAGAAQVYRFGSNVEAYERLASAQAPVAVLVVTEHQDSLFNMSAEQLVERLVDSPMARGQMLGQLRVVVIGTLEQQRDRAIAVPSLRDAMQFIKYGKYEASEGRVATGRNDLAAARQSSAGDQRPAGHVEAVSGSGGFADSLISSIWQAADAAPARQQRPARRRKPKTEPARPAAVMGGGGAQQSSERPSLFLTDAPANAQTEVAPALQPALPVRVPGRNQYRGGTQGYPVAAGTPVAAGVPPQLVSQVSHLVYPGGSGPDPILGWSSATQQQLRQQTPQPRSAAPVQAGPYAAVVPGPQSHASMTPGDVHMHWNGHAPAPSHAPAHAPGPQRFHAPAGAVHQALARIDQRVAAAERAPLVPTGVGRSRPLDTFTERADLLDRSNRVGDVSFG